MLNIRKQREICYEVYDAQGKSVGCVILPRSQRMLGRDQGTVLLRRSSAAQSSTAASRHDESIRKAS